MSGPGITVESFLSYSLASAHRHVQTDLNSKLRSLGVQIETWRVLQFLRSDKRYTMTELANVVLMNPPTLTKLIDRMVSDGLVQRQFAEEDKRCVQLALTDLGVTLCDEVLAHVSAQNDKIMSALGQETVQKLQDILHEVTDVLAPVRQS